MKRALTSGNNNGIIDALGEGLKTFKEGIKSTKYNSAYNVQNHWNTVFTPTSGGYTSGNTPPEVGAKIFLGCVPMVFSALSYLYWRCSDKGNGEWKGLNLGANGISSTPGANKASLRDFMVGMGYSYGDLDTSKDGSHIGSSALKSLNEFSTAMSKAATGGVAVPSNCAYVKFTEKLREEVTVNGDQLSDKCPLSALFYGASCYFQCEQIKSAEKASKNPQTIREMLYFLAALQFSPSYEGLEKQITSVLATPMAVAVSGSKTSNEKLSADQIQEYLITSCSFSTGVIGVIQGSGDSANASTEPWLHSLFCNSAFNFKYVSGSALFSTVSNYAYALQLQLHFLYQQCSNTYTVGCGWRDCRYGSDINKDPKKQRVQSHICQGYNCYGKQNCSHNGTGGSSSCSHNAKNKGCGDVNGKPSPLQAFLTDNLKGFSRGHPSDPSSHLSICSGSLCHVPMGFNPNDLRAESNANTQGSHISATLKAFCGGFNTPLRQLSEKLGCLTKRTPRTLGDLFGFTWHLNGQLFNSNGSGTVDESLVKFFQSLGVSRSNWGTISTLAPSAFWSEVEKRIASLNPPSQTRSGIEKSLTVFSGLPFLYQLFMVKPGDSLPAVLLKVKNIPHQTSKTPQYSGEHDDLYSLYNPVCAAKEKNCGPYLYPLTHSDGATYSPAHASTYLSWVLYLSDDLQSQFQEMLEEFKNIDCKKSGCKSSCNHAYGTHGNPSCKCDSVVQCGGTLPLLYRHGFRYNNPAVLMGGSTGIDQSKRTCANFHSQLQSVVNGDPLSSLLTTIDAFLYAIRWEFFSKLSGFWTIYVCIILYTFFFLLDTLRVRSHLHFPSSNSIAPISLLGTGKAPALRTFTKLTYFMP
ncbi:variant erythrocyte surface antigen-1 family protein [Babesia caballi]|uniref:Variant erythrocyte surface antigen-1 family protein n=1 Tax=Babesia caballi TaxID=5871 RepID=A0AAV4LSD3_BABCB|nr:variant erythrocyte surface antigen-1 family protein [Babesia caballi]